MSPNPKGPSEDPTHHAGNSLSDLLELSTVIASLGPDERKVLLVLARRLLAGQAAYGELNISTDQRDWRKERAEELADALVYGAIAEVAASLGKETP